MVQTPWFHAVPGLFHAYHLRRAMQKLTEGERIPLKIEDERTKVFFTHGSFTLDVAHAFSCQNIEERFACVCRCGS